MGYSQNDIKALNQGIYREGRVRWKWNKGYTSTLYERLRKQGWKMLKSPAGFIVFQDSDGIKINTEILGIPHALIFLAKMMK